MIRGYYLKYINNSYSLIAKEQTQLKNGERTRVDISPEKVQEGLQVHEKVLHNTRH